MGGFGAAPDLYISQGFPAADKTRHHSSSYQPPASAALLLMAPFWIFGPAAKRRSLPGPATCQVLCQVPSFIATQPSNRWRSPHFIDEASTAQAVAWLIRVKEDVNRKWGDTVSWLWPSAPPQLAFPGLSGSSPPAQHPPPRPPPLFTSGWDLGFPDLPHLANLEHPCSTHGLSGGSLSLLVC